MILLSPVYGLIQHIAPKIICFNIRPHDMHSVHAPFDARIVSITPFVRAYRAPKGEIGRVYITFQSIQEPDFYAVLMLEVGKPLYITDRIRIDVIPQQQVSAGQVIGEILLGSFACLYFPTSIVLHPRVDVGNYQRGGITRLM